MFFIRLALKGNQKRKQQLHEPSAYHCASSMNNSYYEAIPKTSPES